MSVNTPQKDAPPFALFIRGPASVIYTLSDQLGFESPMTAMAVSVFEDGPDMMHVQALYETQGEAERAFALLTLDAQMEHFITQLPETDWVSQSQSGLPPVDAGRFWIYGDHDAGTIPSRAAYPIRINAGMAFGTGHHGTTKGCLMIFDKLLKQGLRPASVLDLGCGAGILAIGAAKALDQNILATDIDPDAVSVTLANADYNDVSGKITAHQADGFDSPHLAGQKFDLIFANILAGPLVSLAPDIASALNPEGIVILSGILDEQVQNVSDGFLKAGIITQTETTLFGWTSLTGQLKS